MRLLINIKGTKGKRKGQALVESAIVIPLMVFLILGIVQLVMIQHARFMTEYAAFYAARSGIVWNGDPYIMENAAIIALLPTYDRVRDPGSVVGGAIDGRRLLEHMIGRALLYQINRRLDGWRAQMLSGIASNLVSGVIGGRKVVEVEIVHPTSIQGYELDFDDLYDDSTGRETREANLLTIRLRYLYLMRIPFANWIIHHAWMARRVAQDLYGAIWNPQHNQPEANIFSQGGHELSYQNIGSLLGDPLLRDVAELGDNGIYMIPLETTYTMRMQSNLFRTSINAR